MTKEYSIVTDLDFRNCEWEYEYVRTFVAAIKDALQQYRVGFGREPTFILIKVDAFTEIDQFQMPNVETIYDIPYSIERVWEIHDHNCEIIISYED